MKINNLINDTKSTIKKNANTITKKTKDITILTKEKIKNIELDEVKSNIVNNTTIIATKTKKTADVTQKIITEKLDVNGDGKIDIEDIVILGMRVPGIKINRETFLKKELTRYCDKKTIDEAINKTPALANISKDDIDKIANSVIQYERNCVSGISAALSAPGGVTMVATIPADITQYYGYMLRATQKLLYLYGFQQIDTDEKEGILDSQTMNTLILCLGVMYGVAGANNALKALSKALAAGVSKQFMKTAVTKGAVYPVIKNICKYFSVNLTKKMCVNFFNKAIPVVSGVLGGALTYATFKPCCDKLKLSLNDTQLSNPKHIETKEELELSQQIINQDTKIS